jgi:hypothetical protein
MYRWRCSWLSLVDKKIWHTRISIKHCKTSESVAKGEQSNILSLGLINNTE